jgi:hypothetical protein
MRCARRCWCGRLPDRDTTDPRVACRRRHRRDQAPGALAERWDTAHAMQGARARGDLRRVGRIEDSRPLGVEGLTGFARAPGPPIALRWTPEPEAGEDVDPINRRGLLAGAAHGLSAPPAATAPVSARAVDSSSGRHRIQLAPPASPTAPRADATAAVRPREVRAAR